MSDTVTITRELLIELSNAVKECIEHAQCESIPNDRAIACYCRLSDRAEAVLSAKKDKERMDGPMPTFSPTVSETIEGMKLQARQDEYRKRLDGYVQAILSNDAAEIPKGLEDAIAKYCLRIAVACVRAVDAEVERIGGR